MNKGKKKNPFPEFLERIKGLLDKQKYKEVIDESNEFTRNNFITLKEEKHLEKLVKLAYVEQLEKIKTIDYSKLSREKLLKEMFKTNVFNIFAKAEFVDKVSNKGTSQELDYILTQLKNPNWGYIDVVNILFLIRHCFPLFDGKVTFYDRNVTKFVVRNFSVFQNATKPNGFYPMVEKNIEEQLFKEPSLVAIGKELCHHLHLDFYGFPPKNITPEKMAQHMVQTIRKLVNDKQQKLKN